MTGPGDRTLLVSESRYRFRSLGVRERAVHDWFPQLRALVARRLGERHAAFFAEPAADPSGERIDWYAAAGGGAVPLSSLAEPEALRAEGEVAELLADLSGLAAELAASGREDEQTAGEILRSALFFPDRDQVFLVGGQPVVVFWGFAPAGSEPPRTPLFRRGGVAPGATAVAAGGARSWPWWLALLPLLLLLPLGWRLCAGEEPAVLEARRSGEEDPLAALLERRRALRGTLAEERARYASLLARCEPTRPAVGRRRAGVSGAIARPGVGVDRAAPSAVDAIGAVDAIDEIGALDAIEGGGVLGEEEGVGAEAPLGEEPLPGEPPEIAAVDAAEPGDEGALPGLPDTTRSGEEASGEPGVGGESAGALPSQEGVTPGDDAGELAFGGSKPGQSGEQGEPPGGQGQPLEIPPDAQPGGDPSFLRGRWRSQTKLAQDGSSGGRVQMDFDFDDRGRGSMSVTQDDGTVCRTPARASVGSDGRLRIEAREGARCPDGSRYSRMEVVCETGSGSAADCYADQEEGDRFPLEMRR